MNRLMGGLGFALVTAVLVTACSGASPGGSQSPPSAAGGVEALLADLQRAGAAASQQGTFAPDPLPGQGVLVCVNREPVRVYSYPSSVERAAVTVRINPTDPSNIGNAMVDWVGTPRFWQRDRIVVLYLGPTQAIEALLTSVLGAPFARGQGGRLSPQAETCG